MVLYELMSTLHILSFKARRRWQIYYAVLSTRTIEAVIPLAIINAYSYHTFSLVANAYRKGVFGTPGFEIP